MVTYGIERVNASKYFSDLVLFFRPKFTKHDAIALCLALFIPFTVIILILVSVFLSLGGGPLPDFSNPTKVGTNYLAVKILKNVLILSHISFY